VVEFLLSALSVFMSAHQWLQNSASGSTNPIKIHHCSALIFTDVGVATLGNLPLFFAILVIFCG
jgi:hypothetical protein